MTEITEARLDGLLAGFTDPVSEAQSAFRDILDAMSRPGRIVSLRCPALAPRGLSVAAASVIATLADLDTPLYLDGAFDTPAIASFGAGQCGAPLASGPVGATFALVAGAALLPLYRFGLGDEAYPDRSTTVIVEVVELGAGQVFTLSGPGIDGETSLAVAGLPAGLSAAWGVQHTAFPLGVDLILCAGNRIAALPRSVRLT